MLPFAPLIFEENCSSLQIEWIITELKSKEGHEALLVWLPLPLPSLFNATFEKWPKLMGNYKSPQCIELKEQFYFQGSFLIRTLCSIWTGVCLSHFDFQSAETQPFSLFFTPEWFSPPAGTLRPSQWKWEQCSKHYITHRSCLEVESVAQDWDGERQVKVLPLFRCFLCGVWANIWHFWQTEWNFLLEQPHRNQTNSQWKMFCSQRAETKILWSVKDQNFDLGKSLSCWTGFGQRDGLKGLW